MFLDKNPKSLWQELPSETFLFTNEQMHTRARKFQAKHKRRDIIEYIGFAVLFALVAYMLSVQADWQEWIASGLVVIGAFIAIRNYNRFAKVKSMPSSNSSDALLKFMRCELRRQRDARATEWRWYFLPFTPFIIFTFSYRWVEEGSTLTELTQMRILILLVNTLIAVFLIAYVKWKFFQAAHYQRQLDELESYDEK